MSRRPRVAIGGLVHESNTFTPVTTTVDDFTWFAARGAELVALFADTNSPVGGFLAGAAEEGFEVIPTHYRAARPSGPIALDGFEQLVSELLVALKDALPVDGVLLDLHGAMAAESWADCDGEILRRVRRLVGVETPVVAQLDIHANATDAMVEFADLLVGRRSYPEIDMGDRGYDCAQLLGQLVRREIQPAASLCRLPLIWGTAQATGHGKMKELMRLLDEVLSESDVLTACVLPGFRWADSTTLGSSVYVATDGDSDRASQLTERLAKWIVDHAEHWYEHLPATQEAIRIGRQRGLYPVVLADYLDNTGGGAPGDGTGMLRAFIDAHLEDACVLYVVDPISVERCNEAGVGASVRLSIGGYSHPAQGPPVEGDARVVALSDGRFTYGTLSAGLEGSLGPSARILIHGVHCVLVSKREQPLDPSFAASIGLECHRMRWIGLKSKQHFRAGFEDLAGLIQLVEEPNAIGPTVAYQHLERPLFPLNTKIIEPRSTNARAGGSPTTCGAMKSSDSNASS